MRVTTLAPERPLPSAADMRRQTMTKKWIAALMLSGSLMLAACNTVEGAGRDVQSAGKAVEDAAD